MSDWVEESISTKFHPRAFHMISFPNVIFPDHYSLYADCHLSSVVSLSLSLCHYLFLSVSLCLSAYFLVCSSVYLYLFMFVFWLCLCLFSLLFLPFTLSISFYLSLILHIQVSLHTFPSHSIPSVPLHHCFLPTNSPSLSPTHSLPLSPSIYITLSHPLLSLMSYKRGRDLPSGLLWGKVAPILQSLLALHQY